MLWRKVLVYTHRWLGIAGGVVFVAWFLSGIVMMYVRMPGLATEERLARAAPLDLSTVTLSPAEVAAKHQIRSDRLRVGMLLGRPVYRFAAGREETIVFADTGARFAGLDQEHAADIARRYAPTDAGPLRHDAYLTQPDQWTLQARSSFPMHRFALGDPDDTHFYVSQQTGEVVLRTTRRERFWAYLGPVTHWIYFTPLRQNGPVWTEVVIWSSVVGCVLCLSGLVWGIFRYSPASRFRLKRTNAHSPYAGFMKWHHYAGLLFGVATLTWTYSGLLSMEPFNWFASSSITRQQREAATGGPLRIDALTVPSMRTALATFGSAMAPRELEIMQFCGEPFWMADRPPDAGDVAQWMHVALGPRSPRLRLERHYVSALSPENNSKTRFDDRAMENIARAAMPGVVVEDQTWLAAYDGYYYDPRGSNSLPVLRVKYRDVAQTWLYLDPQRGAIVQHSDRTTRRRRWLYQGLHSLDFPFLYYRRPLWDVVVIALSFGGTVLSAVTLVPAWRRLRRHARLFRAARRSRRPMA